MRMKEGATVNRGHPTQVIADHMQNTCGCTSCQRKSGLSKMHHLSTEERISARGARFLQELQLLQERTTPENHTDTHDSGPESPNRILEFGTAQGPGHLSNVDAWYIDGTHPTAPAIFIFLYVIRAPLGESAVTYVQYMQFYQESA